MENMKTQNSGISGNHAMPEITFKEIPFEQLYTDLINVKRDLEDLGIRYRSLETEHSKGSIGKKKYNNKLEKLITGFGSVGVRHQTLTKYPMSGYEVPQMTDLSKINGDIMKMLAKLTAEMGL